MVFAWEKTIFLTAITFFYVGAATSIILIKDRVSKGVGVLLLLIAGLLVATLWTVMGVLFL